MSLVVLRYPELLALVHTIGRQLEATGATPDRRTQFLIEEGRLDAAVQGIDSDRSEAVAAGGVALAAALDAPHRRLADALAAWRTAARSVVEQPASEAPQRLVAEAQTALINELNAAWTAAAGELDRLLARRIESLLQRMWLHLGTALTLLLTILFVVTFVARQIARPLRMLSNVADTVRRTGDHNQRAEWSSSDEIGRLVAAFNDMLGQLDRERETQKEMAATARAADAQRALVEATPIPLMVTAVPGHEVLHCNPRAEAWLTGGRGDPWKNGLEPGVRQRFFQALSDRGAVDEFEVRWLAGGEPAWAVLSARRVQFQGRDAVLTAFAPINHLKLMERRLALWSKVFEASSEGIVIIGADQRIITVNQAFERHTGYDMAEVVGETTALLAADDAAAASEAMWQAVQLRGTWHGELNIRRRNGSCYPAWVMANAVGTAAQARQGAAVVTGRELSHVIFTSIDISDRKKSEQRIRYLAEHDVLTGLPNRSLCAERLRLALQQAGRSGHKAAVLFIDLDRFKQINDSLGHHIGDGLLRSVSRRLQDAVRAEDTVSRLGGDEFMVVLGNVQHVDEITQVVHQRLLPQVRAVHGVEGAELHVSCSIGIAVYPDDAGDIETLMRNADTAMYHAKAIGRDQAEFFTPAMNERAQSRLQMEADLRRTLAQGQLALHWQPRMRADGRALAGVEGLLRWQHPELGMVPPAQFIPLAEESGLVVAIGAWVVEQACAQVAAWRAAGLPPIGVSINLSPRQLRDDGLADTVQASLARHAVPRGLLELELTESMLMDDAELARTRLHALQAARLQRQFGLGRLGRCIQRPPPGAQFRLGHRRGEVEALQFVAAGFAQRLGLFAAVAGARRVGQDTAASRRRARPPTAASPRAISARLAGSGTTPMAPL